MWVNLKMNDQRNHNLGLYSKKTTTFKMEKRGMSHNKSTYFFAALDWFKQSFVLLHSQREVLTWQVTVHRYLKFIFDQLCAASVYWVWPCNGHQRENPLQKHLSLAHWGQMRQSWTCWSSWLSLGFGKLTSTSHWWILWYPVWLSVFPPG